MASAPRADRILIRLQTALLRVTTGGPRRSPLRDAGEANKVTGRQAPLLGDGLNFVARWLLTLNSFGSATPCSARKSSQPWMVKSSSGGFRLAIHVTSGQLPGSHGRFQVEPPFRVATYYASKCGRTLLSSRLSMGRLAPTRGSRASSPRSISENVVKHFSAVARTPTELDRWIEESVKDIGCEPAECIPVLSGSVPDRTPALPMCWVSYEVRAAKSVMEESLPGAPIYGLSRVSML